MPADGGVGGLAKAIGFPSSWSGRRAHRGYRLSALRHRTREKTATQTEVPISRSTSLVAGALLQKLERDRRALISLGQNRYARLPKNIFLRQVRRFFRHVRIPDT